ncbi:MAG: bifunctional UDP-N-acetylglucosamine diphosphorylase/glucosamine-1-phosphate N-acetyltransferase GlmU [Holosporales bacterium]
MQWKSIILAAGEGTRLRSKINKVMHNVADLPLLGHVLRAVSEAGCSSPIVVVSPKRPEVATYAQNFLPATQVAYQAEQLGTAHAAQCGLAQVQGQGQDDAPMFIVFADTPLIQPHTFRDILEVFTSDNLDVLVLAMEAETPNAYGRLIQGQDGQVQQIIEARDATVNQLKITLCNSGMMVARTSVLQQLLPRIQNINAQREYYLPDVVALAHQAGLKVGHHVISQEEALGVNTRQDLSRVEAAFQARARQEAMTRGVTLIAPETVFFAHDTQIEADVILHPHVVFGPGVAVASDAEIFSYSHLEGCQVESGARIGPFARLRPGTVIGERVHIGNFVEVKNAHIAEGAKANHLSYIGDASVGSDANIGAGTITCNYDGFTKSQTVIGAGAFVGSNTALVAPVTVGAGAIIGAGSVITANVADDMMVVVRADRRDVAGGAKKFRAAKKAAKETKNLKSIGE